jgi:hypothetical protein
MNYRAISLWQPYATLISIGAKRHETRSWSTPHRGPTLIHASKKWTPELAQICLREPFRSALGIDATDPVNWVAPGCTPPTFGLPLGAVVAIAELADCLPTPVGGTLFDLGSAKPYDRLDHAFGDWSAGRYAWRLDRVRPLPEPIPWPGLMGLWTPPAELIERAEAILEGVPDE